MGWFDFVRSPAGTSVETLRIPLFPLNTVLFPGSLLPLKIFEQRYLDMAAACLKDNAPFGICLIEKGSEVGDAALPHKVGTLAKYGLDYVSLAALNPGRTKVSHECVSVDLDPSAALQRRKQLIVRGERIGLHKAYENRTVFVREFQRATRHRHQRHFQSVDGLVSLP